MSALFSVPTLTVGMRLPSAGGDGRGLRGGAPAQVICGVVLASASRSGGRVAPVVSRAGVLVCGPDRASTRPEPGVMAQIPDQTAAGRLVSGFGPRDRLTGERQWCLTGRPGERSCLAYQGARSGANGPTQRTWRT